VNKVGSATYYLGNKWIYILHFLPGCEL
jgi:hypothetical protein